MVVVVSVGVVKLVLLDASRFPPEDASYQSIASPAPGFATDSVVEPDWQIAPFVAPVGADGALTPDPLAATVIAGAPPPLMGIFPL